MTEPDYVRLQVLVHPEWRNARGLAEIEAALRALGFEITGKGAASLSARATPRAYAAAFGGGAPLTDDRAGMSDTPALPVPKPLAGRVQSITVAPQHTVMTKDAKARKQRGKT